LAASAPGSREAALSSARRRRPRAARARATRRFLVGERLSEADLRLCSTLVRFDVAYHGALRCNLKRLADYPYLLAYTRRIYAIPGVADTVRLDHVKRHYWDDHEMINRRIVPIGPDVDFGDRIVVRAA
jgi:glutathionyl-hydroquinone reductase